MFFLNEAEFFKPKIYANKAKLEATQVLGVGQFTMAVFDGKCSSVSLIPKYNFRVGEKCLLDDEDARIIAELREWYCKTSKVSR